MSNAEDQGSQPENSESVPDSNSKEEESSRPASLAAEPEQTVPIPSTSAPISNTETTNMIEKIKIDSDDKISSLPLPLAPVIKKFISKIVIIPKSNPILDDYLENCTKKVVKTNPINGIITKSAEPTKNNAQNELKNPSDLLEVVLDESKEPRTRIMTRQKRKSLAPPSPPAKKKPPPPPPPPAKKKPPPPAKKKREQKKLYDPDCRVVDYEPDHRNKQIVYKIDRRGHGIDTITSDMAKDQCPLNIIKFLESRVRLKNSLPFETIVKLSEQLKKEIN